MGTLFVISISLLAVANGALLTLPVIEKTHASTRIAIGSVFGIAALSWVAFLAALPMGLNAISISVTVAIFAIGLAVQVRFIGRGRIAAALRQCGLSLGGGVYYVAWAALLAWLFLRVVMFYPGGMHTAPANNYGDLPFHFSVITSFAYGENLPPQNPIFGGLGFINFFREFGAQSGGLLNFLSHLPKTYTMNAELALASGAVPLRWGNVFTTLLIPQRSMLFGLPFVTMIIALWWMAVEEMRRAGERGSGRAGERESGRARERRSKGPREGESERVGDSNSPRLPLSRSPALPLPPLSTLRRNSRGHVADAPLARFFFGGNRMRFDGCSV